MLGGVLLLCGIIAASFVVRASVRRLRAIADVAAGIANGSSYSAVAIDAHDEIGAFAVAFNAMVAQVRRLKPQTSKGAYLKKVVLKATMSPAVPLVIH